MLFSILLCRVGMDTLVVPIPKACASVCLAAQSLTGIGLCGIRRVIRGGSWSNKRRNLRSANRNRNNQDKRSDNRGFRLAQSTRAAKCRAQSRAVQRQAGSDARVSMSPVPGLAGMGAPNSFVRDDVGRGW
ncbi:MAG: SUMF1/EgtB/PvdO family nonheme iron enzyme [Candidatus Thiodiazotropha sp.]